MISVDEALAHVLALADFTGTETVALRHAANRVLAEPIVARRSQPPFRASVMDGYAVAGDFQQYQVVGEAAAGHAFDGTLEPGSCVRIFTGAPLPVGSDRVVIQEDVHRSAEEITLKEGADTQPYIREIGKDFEAGDRIEAPLRLSPATLALAASMNVAEVTVARRPVVALIATGDELVMPGEDPNPDQIIASNSFGLTAIVESEGAEARLLPIARDTEASLSVAFELASDADVVVTIGGASVGDHDLVGQVAEALGMDRSFYKIAMRPGKPLMAGRIRNSAMIGLPGNPVSSMVCGHLFLRPLLRAMQGLPKAPIEGRSAPLAESIGRNGPRQHYMRAKLADGQLTVSERQDSSLLSVLSEANALVIRPPQDPARKAGEIVKFIEF